MLSAMGKEKDFVVKREEERRGELAPSERTRHEPISARKAISQLLATASIASQSQFWIRDGERALFNADDDEEGLGELDV